jgi:hypothetical protein
MKILDYFEKNLDVNFIIFIAIISFLIGICLELFVKQLPGVFAWIIAFSIFVIGTLADLKNHIQSSKLEEQYIRKIDEVVKFVESFKGEVAISLESLLRDYPAVQEKLRSPISIFVDTQIASVLQKLSETTASDGSRFLDLENTPSGMVWVIKDADLSRYARIALYFDKAAEGSDKGYIYSTNTVLPSEFDNDPHNFISDHLDSANKLSDKNFSNGMPRLLRLQLLHVKEKPKETIINSSEEFIADLQGIKQSSNFYKFWNKNTYALNVDDNMIKREIAPKDYFERSSFFLGEYILYSNTVVVKWDSSCNVLYLIFGEQIIESYRKIFEIFWGKWKGTSCDITCDITSEILKNRNRNNA